MRCVIATPQYVQEPILFGIDARKETAMSRFEEETVRLQSSERLYAPELFEEKSAYFETDPRLSDYLDRMYAPLVPLVPIDKRLEFKLEVLMNLQSLTKAHIELGSDPDEALEYALIQSGDPIKLANQFLVKHKFCRNQPFRTRFSMMTPALRTAELYLGLALLSAFLVQNAGVFQFTLAWVGVFLASLFVGAKHSKERFVHAVALTVITWNLLLPIYFTALYIAAVSGNVDHATIIDIFKNSFCGLSSYIFGMALKLIPFILLGVLVGSRLKPFCRSLERRIALEKSRHVC